MHSPVLVTDAVYHIFTRSIAGFRIFNTDVDYIRMQEVAKYYRIQSFSVRFSTHARTVLFNPPIIHEAEDYNHKLVEIIAYCIMPTHIHFVLKQLSEDGISRFMGKVLNSYTRYFNTKYKRKGPLWETRFKRVFVEADEQLLHLTRYVHLNPVTANLVNVPQEWAYSSYREYISISNTEGTCVFRNVIDVSPDYYRIFVEKNIDYQRHLAQIKHLILDQNTTA